MKLGVNATRLAATKGGFYTTGLKAVVVAVAVSTTTSSSGCLCEG